MILPLDGNGQIYALQDEKGNTIRYRTYYFNRLPEPRAGGRGGPGAAAPQ